MTNKCNFWKAQSSLRNILQLFMTSVCIHIYNLHTPIPAQNCIFSTKNLYSPVSVSI